MDLCLQKNKSTVRGFGACVGKRGGGALSNKYYRTILMEFRDKWGGAKVIQFVSIYFYVIHGF